MHEIKDPRKPDENHMVNNNSTHEYHGGLRKTVILLKLRDVFFVLEGAIQWPMTIKEMRKKYTYLYNQHQCPTNFARGFEAIIVGNDFDPHGIFEFVDAVWMMQEYLAFKDTENFETYLKLIFPKLNGAIIDE